MQAISLNDKRWLGLLFLFLTQSTALAAALYKYENEEGVVSYSDRPPDGVDQVERIELDGSRPRPTIRMVERRRTNGVDLVAINTYQMPMEVVLQVVEAENLSINEGTLINHVVGASTTELVERLTAEGTGGWSLAYDARFIHGDPRNTHRPETPYRAPFGAANRFPVTQAFPGLSTHNDDGSRYAVDIAMPIGTPVYAARAGLVVDVENKNFAGGTDVANNLPNANIIRVFHDDGSMAIYAHLKWDAIRVRVGDRVAEGEYIADSGNTGFTTGPHLHFDVQLNRENRLVSVPFSFRSAQGAPITPQTGLELQGHP